MDKGHYDSGTYIINVWGYVEVFPKMLKDKSFYYHFTHLVNIVIYSWA